MEAARDFIPFEDEGLGADRDTVRARQLGVDGALAALRAVSSTAVEDAASWGLAAASDFAGSVEEISRTVEYLQVVAASAVDRARKQSAADPMKANTSWTTGWRDDASGSAPASPAAAAETVTAGAAGLAGAAVAWEDVSPGAVSPAVAGGAPAVAGGAAVDDGYRNTVEFLRARLLIGAAEVRRRLALAERLLPRQGLADRLVTAVHEELGAALAAGEIASRAATIITAALDRVGHVCDAEAAARMEHALTRTAADNDQDFLARVARGWTDALDQDGAEPSEEVLRQLQGAFIRRQRHGLHHLEIFATTDQFEHLLTVMNTGANPRTGTVNTDTPLAAGAAEGPASGEGSATGGASHEGAAGWGSGSGEGSATGVSRGWDSDAGETSAAGTAAGWGSAVFAATGWNSAPVGASPDGTVSAAPGASACGFQAAGVSEDLGIPDTAPDQAAMPAVQNRPAVEDRPTVQDRPTMDDRPGAEDPGAAGLDLRSRAQKLLDGLVGGCKVALAAGSLPAAGGLRPQVMVTIDYRDLLTRLGTTAEGTAAESTAGPTDPATTAAAADNGTDPADRAFRHPGAVQETGSLLFTGPVTASTVRKIACDADIIPVLLGGEGRILDIGRASRIFPPHHRKALIARDRGCAFPGCTIPATWCEAHHITYWSHGGTTGTENGVLLCSHHHHVIHKEHWTIHVRRGIPWFIPPPHLDPRQRPRRNHSFNPANLTTPA
ncbi:DUF222 domain-containing protein [Arthrobacter sp. YAF34]|uniref:HNH endonuclease signature motif containing protein n=1 Tax=Arthrobacter sp. YAF34 TaxID=3233083 RepID=UPI003F8DF0CA